VRLIDMLPTGSHRLLELFIDGAQCHQHLHASACPRRRAGDQTAVDG